MNIIAHNIFDRLKYRWLIMQTLSSMFSIESNKPFIGRGDGGYRFIQFRLDNIQLGLRPRLILLVSNKS